jgi:hypothetical protein
MNCLTIEAIGTAIGQLAVEHKGCPGKYLDPTLEGSDLRMSH